MWTAGKLKQNISKQALIYAGYDYLQLNVSHVAPKKRNCIQKCAMTLIVLKIWHQNIGVDGDMNFI